MKWLVAEYRHEDVAGKYYMDKVMTIYWAGFKAGTALTLLPVIVWWIIR